MDSFLKAFVGSVKMMSIRKYDISSLNTLVSYAESKNYNKVVNKMEKCEEYQTNCYNNFRSSIRRKFSYTVSCLVDNNIRTCLVYFADTIDDVDRNEVKIFLNTLSIIENYCTVFISESKISTKIIEEFESSQSRYNIQHFLFEELYYNPLESIWVPKIINILEPDEVDEYLEKNSNYTKDKIAKNLLSDPCIKYLGIVANCLIVYERNNFVNTYIDKEEYMRLTCESFNVKK